MVTQLDICRSANRVIRKCGSRRDPREYAFHRMTVCHAKGDMDEATAWARIAHAIEDILDLSPARTLH